MGPRCVPPSSLRHPVTGVAWVPLSSAGAAVPAVAGDAVPPHGEVGPPLGSRPPPAPPQLLHPAGRSVRKNRSSSEPGSSPGSHQRLPHQGWEPNPETGQGVLRCPHPSGGAGRGAGTPPWGTARRLHPRRQAAAACTTPPPKPRLGWGGGRSQDWDWGPGDVPPHPTRGMCPGIAAQGAPGIPGACWLPARGSRQVPAWQEEEERMAGPSPLSPPPLTLPSATLRPGTPSCGAAHGINHEVWHPWQGRTPSPWLLGGWGVSLPPPAGSPHPRRRAGSWERAIFSPSAPDDAGGFFGSGSLLRQGEQNQSGCLVGLETNKQAGGGGGWVERGGRSGQRWGRDGAPSIPNPPPRGSFPEGAGYRHLPVIPSRPPPSPLAGSCREMRRRQV